ncbi:hypothetical protein pb186bvf_018479 [Paramecium bursaria]
MNIWNIYSIFSKQLTKQIFMLFFLCIQLQQSIEHILTFFISLDLLKVQNCLIIYLIGFTYQYQQEFKIYSIFFVKYYFPQFYGIINIKTASFPLSQYNTFLINFAFYICFLYAYEFRVLTKQYLIIKSLYYKNTTYLYESVRNPNSYNFQYLSLNYQFNFIGLSYNFILIHVFKIIQILIISISIYIAKSAYQY